STIGKTKKNEPLCFGGVVYDRVQLGHRGCGECLGSSFGSNTSFLDEGLLCPVFPKMVLPVRFGSDRFWVFRFERRPHLSGNIWCGSKCWNVFIDDFLELRHAQCQVHLQHVAS